MISAAPPGRATFEVLTIAVTTAYSQPLPFAFTQRLTLHNWQFLTTRLRVFVVALGIGIALELTVANAEEDHVLAYR